ncbi:nucleotidyltransferase, partial [Catenibacterium sp. AM22-15]
IGELLRENKLSVKVLEVQDSWFGVTYKEDAPVVKASFKELIDNNVYSTDLFSDIK